MGFAAVGDGAGAGGGGADTAGPGTGKGDPGVAVSAAWVLAAWVLAAYVLTGFIAGVAGPAVAAWFRRARRRGLPDGHIPLTAVCVTDRLLLPSGVYGRGAGPGAPPK